MKQTMKCVLCMLAMALLLPGQAFAVCGSDPLAHEDVFRLSAVPLNDHSVEVRMAIEPCYYLYQDKLKFSLAPAEMGKVAMPVGVRKQDPHFGQVNVYYESVNVILPFAPQPKGASITLKAEYQGCAEAIGLCYPLSAQMLTFTIPKSAIAGEEVFAREPKKRWL